MLTLWATEAPQQAYCRTLRAVAAFAVALALVPLAYLIHRGIDAGLDRMGEVLLRADIGSLILRSVGLAALVGLTSAITRAEAPPAWDPSAGDTSAAITPIAQAEAKSEADTAIPTDLAGHLDQLEREILVKALEKHRLNRTAAGVNLGLSLRQMRYRMARLGIHVDADGVTVGEGGDAMDSGEGASL